MCCVLLGGGLAAHLTGRQVAGGSSTEFDRMLCLGNGRVIKELKSCSLFRQSLTCITPTFVSMLPLLPQVLYWGTSHLSLSGVGHTIGSIPEIEGEAGLVGMQQQLSVPGYKVGSYGFSPLGRGPAGGGFPKPHF